MSVYVDKAEPKLDGKHTVVGRVIEGVDKLSKADFEEIFIKFHRKCHLDASWNPWAPTAVCRSSRFGESQSSLHICNVYKTYIKQ